MYVQNPLVQNLANPAESCVDLYGSVWICTKLYDTVLIYVYIYASFLYLFISHAHRLQWLRPNSTQRFQMDC